MKDEKISVMQVIDSLAIGGAERMAVNLSNMLPRSKFDIHLCTTRAEGPVESQISPDVKRLRLKRTTRLSEPRAVRDFVRYVRSHDIRIIHCHENTVFLCSIVSLCCPGVVLIWHDHFGPITRPLRLYKLGTLRVRAVISVNQKLAAWAREDLGFPAERVFFVNNFVIPRKHDGDLSLPDKTGTRIVCTANINPTKDILGLVRAMALVVREERNVQTLVIGDAKKDQFSQDYLNSVKKEITELGLEEHVVLLGTRHDVDRILATGDMAVLCSVAEGLPLALIEYGMAGLPTVATDVGQCSEVLGNGKLGLMVSPSDPEVLANAILKLVRSVPLRKELGTGFKQHCEQTYGPESNVKKVVKIYDKLLS